MSAILIACEYSGVLREQLRSLGHDAISCDLLPSEIPSKYHYVGDVRDLLGEGFDALVAFPPCQYLCSSGLHWNKRVPERAAKTEAALEFVQMLMDAPFERIAIENSVGCISSRIRKPDQIIQPYQFGDDASKQTCLWLKGLPQLVANPAERCAGRIVTHNGKQVERWANQCDSGQSNLGPSEDRWMIRSRTFPGIARAMALQWFGRAAKPVAMASQSVQQTLV